MYGTKEAFKRFFNRNRWLLFFPLPLPFNPCAHCSVMEWISIRFVICLQWNANHGPFRLVMRSFALFNGLRQPHLVFISSHLLRTNTMDGTFRKKKKRAQYTQDITKEPFQRSQKIVHSRDEHWAFMLTATTSSQKQSEHPAASSVMLKMANRKDKCYLCMCVCVCFFPFSVWFVLEGRRFAWKFNWLGKSLWISAISFCCDACV